MHLYYLPNDFILSDSIKKTIALFRIVVTPAARLFIMNRMGFLDTLTASTLGCGREQPLCRTARIRPAGRESDHGVFAPRRCFAGYYSAFHPLSQSVEKVQTMERSQTACCHIAGSCSDKSRFGVSGILFENPLYIFLFHRGAAPTVFTSAVLLAVVNGSG